MSAGGDARLGLFMKVNPILSAVLPCARLAVVLFSSLNLTVRADAEESSPQIVVTATRIAAPIDQVASSITVVTGAEIERKGQKTVGEVLRSVPGVDVVRSGGAGGNTVVFLRGANSEHTLVLIDGVEANNPITPNRAFNFADLSTENVERIEIVRGAQSTLYGSDALGGVVNIITRRGSGAPTGEVSVEGGSYSTFTERTAVRGGGSSYDYSFGFSRNDSGGISAADAGDGNSEHDRYGSSAFSVRAGGAPSDTIDLDATFRYESARSDIDDSGGIGGDDPNRIVLNDNLFTRGQATVSFLDGRLQQIWGIGYSDQRFEDNDDPNPTQPNERLRSDYDGSRLKLDVQHNLILTDAATVILGLETEEEKGSSSYRSMSEYGPFDTFLPEQSARTAGGYTQLGLDLGDDLSSTFGIRVDDHDEFGNTVTWRIAPTYRIEQTSTKVAATVGTGYKAPSLFQLYSEYGFAELQPEESLSLDASLEQSIGRGVSIGATWYRNDFDNLITFDPNTFVFSNIAAATTQGVETFVSAEIEKGVDVRLSYTYLDSEDDATGEALLRRARHKAAAELTFDLAEGLSTTMSGIFVGVRDDNDFSTYPATRTTLASYFVVNAAMTYQIAKGVNLFARAENIFDREYQEVLGYGSLGAAGYGGLKVVFE